MASNEVNEDCTGNPDFRILVTAPPTGTSPSEFTEFLKGIAGEVQHIHIEHDHAVVTLTTLEAANTLVSKSPVKFKGKSINIYKDNYDGGATGNNVDAKVDKSVLEKSSVASNKLSSSHEPEQATIVVYGVPENLHQEEVELHFRNESRTGGGDIKDLDFDPRNGIKITFASSTVARNVVKMKDHKINNCPLTVKMYIPPMMEEKQFLIFDIKHKISEDTLINFLEVKLHLKVENIKSVMPGIKLVQFTDKIDFEALKRACKSESGSQKYLSETYLKVRQVPVPTKIIVSNIPADMNLQSLEFYFGTPDEPVSGKMLPGKICIITFKDATVAAKMSKLKHPKFDIKLYNDYVDGKEVYINIKIPSPFWIEFIVKHKEEFEDKIKDFGIPCWAESDLNSLKIMYNNENEEEEIIKRVKATVHEELIVRDRDNYEKLKGEIKKDQTPIHAYFDDTNFTAHIFSFNKSEVADYCKKMASEVDKSVLEKSSVASNKRSPSHEPEQATIVVHGVPESLNPKELKLHFQNRCRTGGGEIKDFKFDLKNGTKITFASSIVARDVLKTKDHKINNHPLTVEMYVPPMMEQKQALIFDIKPTIGQDTLINFLEVKLHLESKIEHIKAVAPGRWCVQFTDEIDFEALKSGCKSESEEYLSESYLKVRQIPVPTKIIVSNIPADINLKSLEFYFGTPEEPVSGKMLPDGRCIITFEDATVAAKMSKAKHPKFDIQLYNDYEDGNETYVDIKLKEEIKKDQTPINDYFGRIGFIPPLSFNKSEATDDWKKIIDVESKVPIEEVINLRAHEIEIFFLSDFYSSKIYPKYPKLKICNQGEKLVLKGLPKDVKAVCDELVEFFKYLYYSQVELPQNTHHILSLIPVKEYIKRKLKNEKCICVWVINSEKQVIIYVLHRYSLQLATGILQKSIVFETIELTSQFKTIMEKGNYDTFMNVISMKYADKYYIETQQDKISIVTIDEEAPKLKYDIETFFKSEMRKKEMDE